MVEFLKQHYEKIILTAVLLGVIIAAALLPGIIAAKQDELRQRLDQIVIGPSAPVKLVDLAGSDAALKRLQEGRGINLSGSHNVVNPVRWVLMPDGSIRKVGGRGPDAFTSVQAIRPLYFKVVYQGTTTSANQLRYKVVVTDETSLALAGRKPKAYTVEARVGARPLPQAFVVADIKGPLEDPTELTLKFTPKDREEEDVAVGKDERLREFKRVAGQEADIQVEGRRHNGQRVGSPLYIDGELYIIVAISPTDVTLQSQATRKKSTISLPAASDTTAR
jgi:hypothetical protein